VRKIGITGAQQGGGGGGGSSSSSKPSVTIQPFYCLHLDIDKPNIKTLEDALDAYMEPEKLEGYHYTDDVRGVTMEVQAVKHTSIEALPKVLVLHLKRFAYDSSQARKLDKFIPFPQKLTIKKHFLSNDKVAPENKRVYSLCSVVEHHGKVAVKGHYTCDINKSLLFVTPVTAAAAAAAAAAGRTPAGGGGGGSSSSSSGGGGGGGAEWLNFDDQIVRRVSGKDVQSRLAYLLFYVQN